ncbi:SH3-like domain-containing protein [Litoreibacter roseus]|uniref:Nitrile hydratase beta subunit domain-containing protein n=1 Tax=Litoreibacter roseus TaxID=2601869 RepID=A0A6N6JCU7_9RHOB|nr:hypothetical protein KIN_07240 [Litoreibacter roseus]
MNLTPGTRVRIRAWSPPGHIRTPNYLRGRTGIIERALGPFENPEQRAYALPAPKRELYRVRFSMAEIWGSDAERPEDTLDAEVYAHWLEEA